ncbi:hypothetical protein RB595_000396 [Gaeumannomyces hyphopodioides]
MMMTRSSTAVAALAWMLASAGSSFVASSPTELTGRARLEENLVLGGTIEWKGVLEEGKPEVILSGKDFEEIERKAKDLNPSYTIFAAENSTALEARSEALDSRQTVYMICDHPLERANVDGIREGIAYLRTILGNCRAGPGPYSCGRVSCSWNAAIHYCNDNPTEHWEPCRWIGDVADNVVNQCQRSGQVSGEARDERRWYTVVGRGNC